MSIETTKKNEKEPPESAIALDGEKAPELDATIDIEKLPKTPGEKFYGITQFIVGKVFILAATAALAFVADKDKGPDKIFGTVPNFLKSWNISLQNALEKPPIKVKERGPHAGLFAYATVSMLVLSYGGHAFAPFIRWFENSKEKIANAYNKRFGTERDVAITKERLKDEPKQNWGDVIKGRIMAMLTVFVSILGVYSLVGRTKYGDRTEVHDKDGKEFRMELYEDYVGRGVAGIFGGKKGKEIWQTPMKQSLTKEQKHNRTYEFGKILAIDVFATSMGLIMWNLFSRNSAKKRHEKKKAANTEAENLLNQQKPQTTEAIEKTLEVSNDLEKPSSKKPLNSLKKVEQGYTEMVKNEPEPHAELSPAP
jgi:hypothetical protein